MNKRILKIKNKTMKIKNKKNGGSLFKISPNFVQSLVNKMKKKRDDNKINREIMSRNNVIKRQALMKLNHNLKIRNLTKKNNSSSSEYSENAKIINTSGEEWNIQIGNNTKEKVPNVLLPERTRKKTVFIRISSSHPKLNR